MNTYELTSLLNRAPKFKHLHGQVCAKDLLPEEKPLDVKAFIINTDTSDKPSSETTTRLSTLILMDYHHKKTIFYHSFKRIPDTRSTTKKCYGVHGVESVACTVSTFWINSEEDLT